MVRVCKSFLRCTSITIWACFVFAPWALPQTPPVPADLDRVKELVQAGALPRAALDKALAEQDDRADESVLRRTLYGTVRVEDLNERQTEDMLAAARRRVDSIEVRVAELKPMVDQGFYARNALAPLLEDRDDRLRTLKLAEGRAQVFHELLEMAKAEASMASLPATEDALPVMVRFDGNGIFNELQFRRVQKAFEKQFAKPLPISASGETLLHRSLGFDHRGRVDLALSPDLPEGIWLKHYLEKEQIPYFLFRAAVAGSATGPHFHLGPPSLRLKVAD